LRGIADGVEWVGNGYCRGTGIGGKEEGKVSGNWEGCRERGEEEVILSGPLGLPKLIRLRTGKHLV